MEPLLTTEDVAEFFRVDVVTVRRMIGKGELTAYRVGGEYRFARGDIEEYLERQRVPARAAGRGRLGKLARLAGKGTAGPLPNAFGRFTGRAQNVLARAQEEASSLRHPALTTEHLLLAILREGDGLGATLLDEVGCDLADVRRITAEPAPGPAEACAGDGLPLTPRLKKVLQLSVEEATRLGHDSIGTEHLVLGLLHEGESAAAETLRAKGMGLAMARTRIVEMLAGRGAS